MEKCILQSNSFVLWKKPAVIFSLAGWWIGSVQGDITDSARQSKGYLVMVTPLVLCQSNSASHPIHLQQPAIMRGIVISIIHSEIFVQLWCVYEFPIKNSNVKIFSSCTNFPKHPSPQVTYLWCCFNIVEVLSVTVWHKRLQAKLFLCFLKYQMYFKIKQCPRHKREFFLCVNYWRIFFTYPFFFWRLVIFFFLWVVYGLNLLFAN